MDINGYKVLKKREDLIKDHPEALKDGETIGFTTEKGSTYLVKLCLKDQLQSNQAESMRNAAQDGSPLVCDCNHCDKTESCSNRH